VVDKQTSHILWFEPTFHLYLLKSFQNLEAPTTFVELANTRSKIARLIKPITNRRNHNLIQSDQVVA